MARRKTSSKVVLIFIVASITLVLALAYLFKPPPRARTLKRDAQPAAPVRP